jgi:nucleotidyltransferase substrate binding protein (TIGR01987 family)
MEQSQDIEKRLRALRKAIESFKLSIGIDTSRFGAVELDTVRSGQAQKFEVCVELFWKTMKRFIYDIHGEEAVSPKMVMKQLYRLQYIEAPDYEILIEMINDRNRLSHVYNEVQFNAIHRRLPQYLDLMETVVRLV